MSVADVGGFAVLIVIIVTTYLVARARNARQQRVLEARLDGIERTTREMAEILQQARDRARLQ